MAMKQQIFCSIIEIKHPLPKSHFLPHLLDLALSSRRNLVLRFLFSTVSIAVIKGQTPNSSHLHTLFIIQEIGSFQRGAVVVGEGGLIRRTARPLAVCSPPPPPPLILPPPFPKAC